MILSNSRLYDLCEVSDSVLRIARRNQLCYPVVACVFGGVLPFFWFIFLVSTPEVFCKNSLHVRSLFLGSFSLS